MNESYEQGKRDGAADYFNQIKKSIMICLSKNSSRQSVYEILEMEKEELIRDYKDNSNYSTGYVDGIFTYIENIKSKMAESITQKYDKQQLQAIVEIAHEDFNENIKAKDEYDRE